MYVHHSVELITCMLYEYQVRHIIDSLLLPMNKALLLNN